MKFSAAACHPFSSIAERKANADEAGQKGTIPHAKQTTCHSSAYWRRRIGIRPNRVEVMSNSNHALFDNYSGRTEGTIGNQKFPITPIQVIPDDVIARSPLIQRLQKRGLWNPRDAISNGLVLPSTWEGAELIGLGHWVDSSGIVPGYSNLVMEFITAIEDEFNKRFKEIANADGNSSAETIDVLEREFAGNIKGVSNLLKDRMTRPKSKQ
jgi:hypothetical protein